MTEEGSAPAARADGRGVVGEQRVGSGARRRLTGPELVDTLTELVDQVIEENRRLRRQVARLTGGVPVEAAAAGERTLRSLHRKVERALAGSPAPPRRRSGGSRAARTRRAARLAPTAAD